MVRLVNLIPVIALGSGELIDDVPYIGSVTRPSIA
jgi:hypothetical protein